MSEAEAKAASEARIDQMIDLYRSAKGDVTSGGNAQTITVNGAGAVVTALLISALVISTVCCGYMAGAIGGLQSQLQQNQDDLRGMQDYLNVLYKRSADQKAKADADHHPR